MLIREMNPRPYKMVPACAGVLLCKEIPYLVKLFNCDRVWAYGSSISSLSGNACQYIVPYRKKMFVGI